MLEGTKILKILKDFVNEWLRMVDEHEELFSCSSGWRVLPV